MIYGIHSTYQPTFYHFSTLPLFHVKHLPSFPIPIPFSNFRSSHLSTLPPFLFLSSFLYPFYPLSHPCALASFLYIFTQSHFPIYISISHNAVFYPMFNIPAYRISSYTYYHTCYYILSHHICPLHYMTINTIYHVTISTLHNTNITLFIIQYSIMSYPYYYT